MRIFFLTWQTCLIAAVIFIPCCPILGIPYSPQHPDVPSHIPDHTLMPPITPPHPDGPDPCCPCSSPPKYYLAAPASHPGMDPQRRMTVCSAVTQHCDRQECSNSSSSMWLGVGRTMGSEALREYSVQGAVFLLRYQMVLLCSFCHSTLTSDKGS